MKQKRKSGMEALAAAGKELVENFNIGGIPGNTLKNFNVCGIPGLTLDKSAQNLAATGSGLISKSGRIGPDGQDTGR